jgi:hypothetical protein
MQLGTVKTILKQRGYKLFTRPYELNIVGIRSNETTPNRFDDQLHVFYKTNSGDWVHHQYQITTDPGTFWLNNPLLPQGTAILSPAQYVGAYKLGLHRGQYTALVQVKPVTVIRDYNRNNVLDFFNGTKDTGYHGINIHKATGTTPTVDKDSAGCQVFENLPDFEEFMNLCQQAAELYGNSFTYTLVDFRQVARARLRKAAYISVFVILAAVCIYSFLNDIKGWFK